jgi:hypothetical protein
MKTYILRNPKPVEPQKSSRSPRPEPAVAIVGRRAMPTHDTVLFIGLDVQNAHALHPPKVYFHVRLDLSQHLHSE